MSCAAFTFLGVYVLAAGKSNQWALGVTFGTALLMLLVASFLAWKDQYRRAESLALELATLKTERPELVGELDQIVYGDSTEFNFGTIVVRFSLEYIIEVSSQRS